MGCCKGQRMMTEPWMDDENFLDVIDNYLITHLAACWTSLQDDLMADVRKECTRTQHICPMMSSLLWSCNHLNHWMIGLDDVMIIYDSGTEYLSFVRYIAVDDLLLTDVVDSL